MKKKTQILAGHRIGRRGKISVGACAVVFDRKGRILLMCRSDNGQWCLPGGKMEPGESLRETCERELAEEVGIRGSVTALISITSSPDWLVIFPDGNKCQFVSALYLVKARSTKIATSCEATAARFFSKRELAKIDLIANHRERVADAFRFRGAVIER